MEKHWSKKVKQMEETKKVFLSWKDDDETIKATYVNLISVTDTMVIFITKNNKIYIPISRILKMKEEME